jgi:hypothetical protein
VLKHAELGLCTIYSLCALQFLSVCRLGNVVHINSFGLLRPVFSFTCVSFTSKFFEVKMLIQFNIWNLFLSMSLHHLSIEVAGKGCCDVFSVYLVNP